MCNGVLSPQRQTITRRKQMTPGSRLFLKQVGLAPKQALTTQCRICEGPVAEGQHGHGSGVRQQLQIPCAIHYGVPPAHLTIAFRNRPRWLKPVEVWLLTESRHGFPHV